MITFGMHLEIVLPVYKDLEYDNTVMSFRVAELPNLVFYTEIYRAYGGYNMYRLLSEQLIEGENAEVGLFSVECTWTDTVTN